MFRLQTLFSDMYQYCLSKASHPHAMWWLAFFAVIEAVIFPIPVYVMLVPMILANPSRTWRLTAFTTFFSVIGAIIGYWLGVFAFEWLLEDFFTAMGYMGHFETVSQWFQQYGIWCLLIGSVTPIPFKVFTIAAGISLMPFVPFVLTCIIGRAARYYIISALAYFGKNHIDTIIIRYMDKLGWVILGGLAVTVYWLW